MLKSCDSIPWQSDEVYVVNRFESSVPALVAHCDSVGDVMPTPPKNVLLIHSVLLIMNKCSAGSRAILTSTMVTFHRTLSERI